MSQWLEIHKGSKGNFILALGNNDGASCGENRTDWTTVRMLSLKEAYALWKDSNIRADFYCVSLFQSLSAEEPLFKSEEPTVSVEESKTPNKDAFRARLEKKVKEEGLVDFKPDIDVYAVAEKYGLGIKLVMVGLTPDIQVPRPVLDFTNAYVTKEFVEEEIYGEFLAMFDAIDNGQTEVVHFNDSQRVKDGPLDLGPMNTGQQTWRDGSSDEIFYADDDPRSTEHPR